MSEWMEWLGSFVGWSSKYAIYDLFYIDILVKKRVLYWYVRKDRPT